MFVVTILDCVDLQDRLTNHGADLTLGSTYRKEPTPVAAQEQAQHTAANFGWVAQLWAMEVYSQVAVAVQPYRMALAVGAAGAQAAKYWSLSNKE